MVFYRELPKTTRSAICVEESWAFRTEVRFGTRLYGESEYGTFLVAEKVSVDDPLCIDTVVGELFRNDCWPGVLLDEIRILIRCKIKLLDKVFPVFVTVFGIIFFAAGVESIGSTNTPCLLYTSPSPRD